MLKKILLQLLLFLAPKWAILPGLQTDRVWPEIKHTQSHLHCRSSHTHRPDALQSFLIRDVMKPLTVSDKVECVRHPAAFMLQTP